MRVRGRPRYWIVAGAVLALYAVALVALFGRLDRISVLTMVNIDSYPARTKVTGCADPLVGKAGVQDFRTLILSQMGGGDDGLAVCKKIANGSGSFSDHADGRAWDWHVKASNASDRAKVNRVLNWLLRTDELGNRNAMARRIGITYIIWNHQIYRVSSDTSQWSPYTSTSDPHDTHVHFSFSVAGATRAHELVERARAAGLVAVRFDRHRPHLRVGTAAPVGRRLERRWSGHCRRLQHGQPPVLDARRDHHG